MGMPFGRKPQLNLAKYGGALPSRRHGVIQLPASHCSFQLFIGFDEVHQKVAAVVHGVGIFGLNVIE